MPTKYLTLYHSEGEYFLATDSLCDSEDEARSNRYFQDDDIVVPVVIPDEPKNYRVIAYYLGMRERVECVVSLHGGERNPAKFTLAEAEKFIVDRGHQRGFFEGHVVHVIVKVPEDA